MLQVSDRELRQPGQEVMVKLSGAKDKLGLRMHSLTVVTPVTHVSGSRLPFTSCVNPDRLVCCRCLMES